MKLKNILENIVNEGASDIMYHFVEPKYILKILENNKLTTIAAMGSDTDYKINKNKFYYLSTTRSRSSGYKEHSGKLVLDGRKLKHKYEFAPVDYFKYPKNPEYFLQHSQYIENMESLEQEDRIITDKPSIPNAIKYILEIHIRVGSSTNNDKVISKIIKLCEQYQIPIFLYDSVKNYLNQRNPIDITKFKDDNFGEDGYASDGAMNAYARRNFDEIAYLLSFNNDDLYETILRYIGKETDVETFKDEFKIYKEKYLEEDSKYKDELVKSVKNNITFIQSNSSDDARFILELLRRDLRKNRVTTIEDYIKLKVSK